MEEKTKKKIGRPKKAQGVDIDAVFSLMQKMDKRMDGIENRISKVENPIADEFKLKAKQEDIEKVEKQVVGVDPKIKQIVQEVLGPDFGIDIENYEDRVGLGLTIIVPQRLSLLPVSTRPILKSDGEYKQDAKGNILEEEYYPEDRRSKQLTSMDSYDVVREHCEKIKKNIVLTYQKLNKPLPPFTK